MKNNLLIPNKEGRSPDSIIQKASNIACVVQCGGIWMANGNFGVSWKLFQGKYKENLQLQVGKGVCHVPVNTEDTEEVTSSDETVVANHSTMVESDDDEEENHLATEEEESSVAAEPEKKPKKKRVVNKKVES